jgi:hypothetical protein
MSKLKEKTIQDKALVVLKKHYQQQRSINNIYACTEAWTRKERGGKRADGLICFKTNKGQYYTVSMEAKSHKTLQALTSSVNEDRLGWNSLLAAGSLTLGTAAVCFTLLDLKWWIVLLSALLLFFISLVCFIALFDRLDLNRHRLNSVVEQLKQYPANEQWLVYSKHADNLLATLTSNGRRSHLQSLISLCKQNGFGLLLLSNQKIHLEIEPKPRKGDFLDTYSRAPKIKEELNNPIILETA